MSAIPAVVKGVTVVPSIISSIMTGLGAGGIAGGIAGKAGAFDGKGSLIEGSNMTWEEITKMFNLPINAKYEDVYSAWQNRFKTLRGVGAVSIQAGVQSPAKWRATTKTLINKIISSGNTGLIKYRYGSDEMSNGPAFKNALANDPKMIEIISDYGFKNKITKPQDIWEKMRKDNEAQERLLKYLKGAEVKYKPLYIRPNKQINTQPNIPTTVTPTVITDGGEDIAGIQAQDGARGDIKKDSGDVPNVTIRTGQDTEAIPETKTKTKDKNPPRIPKPPKERKYKDRDPETDEDSDPEDEKDDGDKIKEKPIKVVPVRRKKDPARWYPTYNFGGQSILKLTDVEKLEDLKNWTLFDLVNPLLEGDPENLLSIHNKIQEQRRFYNTFENPKPEPTLPEPPNLVSYQHPMKNIYDNKMPMYEDTAKAQRYYYDTFNDQGKQYSQYKLDLASQGHLQNPDMERLLNKNKLEFQGLLNIDTKGLSFLDFK
jgi:hypothetical protein